MNELIDFSRLLVLAILGPIVIHCTAHATEWFKMERKPKEMATGGEPNQSETDSSPVVLDGTEPVRFSYQQPIMYRPRYYYTPRTFTQRFFGSSCPNCR